MTTVGPGTVTVRTSGGIGAGGWISRFSEKASMLKPTRSCGVSSSRNSRHMPFAGIPSKALRELV
jgi:hypothetical protein